MSLLLLTTHKMHHSDNLSWFLEPLKHVVDKTHINKKLYVISNNDGLSQNKGTILLDNAVNSKKRKVDNVHEIMCKDYVDTMEKWIGMINK